MGDLNDLGGCQLEGVLRLEEGSEGGERSNEADEAVIITGLDSPRARSEATR